MNNFTKVYRSHKMDMSGLVAIVHKLFYYTKQQKYLGYLAFKFTMYIELNISKQNQ
jgi:hypothetical protein